MKTFDKILYLRPRAKFSIWDCLPEEFHLGTEFVVLDSQCVIWDDPRPCPTQKELDDLDNTSVSNDIERRRKQERDITTKNNLEIRAGLQMARISEPTLTLSDYLDQLEAMDV